MTEKTQKLCPLASMNKKQSNRVVWVQNLKEKTQSYAHLQVTDQTKHHNVCEYRPWIDGSSYNLTTKADWQAQ